MKMKTALIIILFTALVNIDISLAKDNREVISAEKAQAYQQMKLGVLELNPKEVEINPSRNIPTVWGVLIEFRTDGDTLVSLVALADRTVSLYFEDGGGAIGAGYDSGVWRSAKKLISAAENNKGYLTKTSSFASPDHGHIRIYALTFSGILSIDRTVDDLKDNKMSANKLFYAGSELLSALRLFENINQLEKRIGNRFFASIVAILGPKNTDFWMSMSRQVKYIALIVAGIVVLSLFFRLFGVYIKKDPIKAYDGRNMPQIDIASIVTDSYMKHKILIGLNKRLFIRRVDKKRIWQFLSEMSAVEQRPVDVLPGKHEISLLWTFGNSRATCDLWFVAERGKRYIVKAAGVGYNVRFWMEELGTGHVVGGAKDSADEPRNG